MIMSGIISLDIIQFCSYNRIKYYTSTVHRNSCSLLCLYNGPNHLSKWSNSSFITVPATLKKPLLGILFKLLLGFCRVENVHWKSWICNRNLFLTYIACMLKKPSHLKISDGSLHISHLDQLQKLQMYQKITVSHTHLHPSVRYSLSIITLFPDRRRSSWGDFLGEPPWHWCFPKWGLSNEMK